MNISRGKQQELKEIDGSIDDINEQVHRLLRLVDAQPELALVSGTYDMHTDVRVLEKTLDLLKARLYLYAFDSAFMTWKHIK
jgi:hypothetical protein